MSAQNNKEAGAAKNGAAKNGAVKAHRVSFDDLTLHYQPQMSADGSRIVSAEALLRVINPTPRLMGPADVLKHFDAPDDAAALDWWVLYRACSDALRWPGISVAVNLTADRFRDPGFVARLAKMVQEIGLPPSRIELEIVESSYIEDFGAAVANINALRALGFRVALDDFGTGFSSLTYLLKLPVDKVKIDKSFVDGVAFMQSAAIVHAVVALARALGLKVTAEGVETPEQHRFLKAAGCHYMQGWLFSKAVEAKVLSAMLEREKALLIARV
jgi:EAL domain-containing protein (putative c-di-GMP-specific phosphodiesterase class I)